MMEYQKDMNLPKLRSREPPASIEEEIMLIRMPAGKAVCASGFWAGKVTI